jgi:hypothetical protein
MAIDVGATLRAGVFSLCLSGGGTATQAATPWPQWDAPAGARVQAVAPEVILNGKRSRILRIDSGESAENMLGFYRARLGAMRVENRVHGAQVIGARDGAFFHTVQVRTNAAGRAETTVITTALAEGLHRSAVVTDTENSLPAETTVIQTMESNDGGVRAVTVTAANSHDVKTNSDHLRRALQERGFRVVKEEAASSAARGGNSIWLTAQGEEAIVTVIDTGAQRAVTVHRTKEPK